LSRLSDKHHDWQVQQAEEAIRLYLYFQNQSSTLVKPKTSEAAGLWAQAIEQMVASLRLKHLAYRTEQTYLAWDASVQPVCQRGGAN